MPKIVIRTGDRAGEVFRLSQDELTVGRDPDNDIILPDRRISRRHARLVRKGEGYVLEDAGSVNGTAVNQKNVTQHQLRSGDEIAMGSTTMTYLPVDAPERPGADRSASRVRVLKEDDTRDGLTVELKARPSSPDWETRMNLSDPADVARAFERLKILFRISRELEGLVDQESLYERMLALSAQTLKAEQGLILLADRESGELFVRAVYLGTNPAADGEAAYSRTIVRQVMESGEAVLTSDAQQDERFQEAQSIISQGIRSTLCVPIHGKDRTLGVMQLETRGQVVRFSRDDLELLSVLAAQAAAVIENAQLVEDLRRANTELRTQQNQLVEAEKLSALGRLAGGVAHEINNPMTCILGYSELAANQLERPGVTPDQVSECVEQMRIVHGEAQRCQRIVQSLLQFGRRKKEEMTEVSINDVVEAALTIARFHIKKAPIKICQEMADDLPAVTGDRNQLQQVFLNMIINARDAMESGGTLTISTGNEEDGRVAARFSDTGCGIPPDKLEEIFKPLYTSKEEGKGTGLGLSISQDIVERHKGMISVDSVPGKGTTFTIALPVRGAS